MLTDVSCFGQCDGSATAAVSGGTAPYTYLWSANTGTSTTNIILCAGNQTLTISDASGCSVDTAFVIVQPPLLVIEDVTVVDESCALDCNGSIIIQAPLAATFSIDGGATFHATADFLDLCPGNYEVIVADATGCEATQEIQVVAGLPVIGSFIPRPDVVPELDSEILFDNNSTGAVAYTWHFGDGSYSNEENPRYDFGNQPGTYLVCLAADNGDGCIDTACAYVDVTPLFTMYVPNAFSPNASTDINDEFRPIFTGERPETYHLRIFNRWGDKIFETNNIEKGWDGMYEDKLVESGVYVWLIDIKREEGGKNRQHAGHVTRL